MDDTLLDELDLAYREAECEVFDHGLTAQSPHLTDPQRRLLLRLECAAQDWRNELQLAQASIAHGDVP
jgi:hypothetical protein